MQTNYVPAVIAAGISLVMHGFLLAILVMVPSPLPEETVADAGLEPVIAQKHEEKNKDFFDDVGEPDKDLGGLDPNPSELKDDVATPIRENEPTGVMNEAPAVLNEASIPPPPGLTPGVFQGPETSAEAGIGAGTDLSTGMGGIISAGGMVGRSGGGKKAALSQGGGTEVSEAAVARGLRWLANTQNKDGSWSIEKLGGNTKNEVAGAALGVLPFLAAGITHRPNSEKVEEPNEAGKKVRVDHSPVVQRALNFLMLRQNKRTGAYNENAYAHSLATIAMCEACGLTGDPQLRASAQRSIAYVIEFQDPKGGGWRYTPKQEGDMSVTGWMFMALKSAQMAGIRVPADRYKLVERFLDQCLNRGSGGYGYQDANASPAMTAAGMLCRLYLGTRPNNETLRKGAKIILGNPPSANGDLYYLYYATQAMHHMGTQDECWELWNLGPNRNGKGGIRDYLIEKQVGGPRSTKAAPQHLAGSWNPEGDTHAVKEGGRLMQTSLALLTLEVYYRHLPLYMSDAGR